ncbi:MAG: fasciclin domain-containing protein [Phycisphaerales bacterium]|nr:fasciclin domain-containing protein [Phycisphaerales bacterium]
MPKLSRALVLSALVLTAGAGVALTPALSTAQQTSTPPAPAAAQQNLVQIAAGNKDFSTLVAAVQAAGLAETLSGAGPFTIFAPTNEAFAKLPKGTVESLLKPENKAKLTAILTYHVVPARVPAADAVKATFAPTVNGQRLDLKLNGSELSVDSAKVIKTDIFGSNGVIHVIDTVVLPTEDNIPAVATRAGSFKTLLAAATAAGLVPALSGDKALTVLAPTDDAFAKLPKGTLEKLLKPENKDALATILKLHVIEGRVYSDQAIKSGTASTLAGENVKFSVKDGKASVNGSNIVSTDIDASNGVIHVIDAVILPATMPKLSMRMPNADEMTTPRDIAALAINKGAPMFNHGDHTSCVAVYEVAMTSILAMNTVCCSTKSELRTAMNSAQHSKSAADKAWALRRGLDTVMQMPLASRE